MKKDFFISRTGVDKEWAEWVAWQLEEAGYSVVVQDWDFRPGQNFVLRMDEAIRTTEKTIAILSPDYLAADYTAPEWAATFAKDPKGKESRLIIVRVKECAPDGLLTAVIYIDLMGNSEDEAKERLLDGVRLGRAKPSAPPSFPEESFYTAPTKIRLPGIGPHITSLLKACERLAAQVEDLPSPEDVVAFAIDRRNHLEPQHHLHLYPPRYQLPPGRVIDERLFRLIYEHTREDPHWKDLGFDGAWWIQYNVDYVHGLLDLIEDSLNYLIDRVSKAQKAIGNRSLPEIKTPFAAIPIRDALRLSMGLPPVIGRSLDIDVSTSGKDDHTICKIFSLKYEGMLIATIMDDRPFKENPEITRDGTAAWNTTMNIYHEFEQLILASPEPLEIIGAWYRLQERAKEFASWLRSLSVRSLRGTKCSLCDTSIATPIYSKLLESGKPLVGVRSPISKGTESE